MKVLSSIFFCFTILYFSNFSVAIDTLLPNQTISDNGQTLISAGQSFELGFFSPWSSNYRYIGIWFKNVPQQTVFWVANRNNPVSDSTGVFAITPTGNLVLLSNQSETTPVWSLKSSKTSSNPVLQLLDTGNLVVRDGFNYVWQSFDHPCDTIIPGMKMGWNLATNQSWSINSWKSNQDPSNGDYTYNLDNRGVLLPQTILRKGTLIVYRSGPWDGVRFGGSQPLRVNSVFKPIFVFNSTAVYYSFVNNEASTISRLVVNQSGTLQILTWNQRRGEWVTMATLQNDLCDTYGQCGPNGLCDMNRPVLCHCPTGFEPKVPQDWGGFDWTGGCARRTPLNCSAAAGGREGFKKFPLVKLPDSSQLLVKRTAKNSAECEEACLRDCGCTAYAKTEVRGCVAWFGDLQDMRLYSEGGQDLYIRMAATDLGSNNGNKKVVIVSVSVSAGIVLLVAVIWFAIWKRNSRREQGNRSSNPFQDEHPDDGEEDLDQLPLYDFSIIASATNNFSYTNKIGEGGFGAVYKGEISPGQEIAVKRLSKDSGQGLKEFKNEVIFISMLQHRNLVRLLGCCIHGEEKMLVYEYMAKRSLDLYLYNQTRGTSLDWDKRYNIIVGVARGLLYLHRDSRLRIIHRDLKASNILLDDTMNPKISDFGLARTFGGDQNEANTNRVIGTYGYMSPEYAIDGLFSVKSDVFSFGVVVLEIVSGQKNRGFYHPDHDLNLLGHAWRLWIEGRPMELMDGFMEQPVPASALLKCIHIGLLCVQQRPEDRPMMSSVMAMLDNENPILPQPKQPGFYTERFFNETTDSSSVGQTSYTPNEVTVTVLRGR